MELYGKTARLVESYGPDILKLYVYDLNGRKMLSLVDSGGNIDNLIWYGEDIGSGNIIGFDGTFFGNQVFQRFSDLIEKHALEEFKKGEVK